MTTFRIRRNNDVFEIDWTWAPMERVTFAELALAMKSGKSITLRGCTGRVLSIETEDGSGNNWNVKMRLPNVPLGVSDMVTVYFRTQTAVRKAA